ncbi:MAG: flap endonuclease-1 [Candidatus Micrarchaeia archaeon]
MAVDISKLVGEVKERIELNELSGKKLAIDAYNTIYQFLSIIRQPNGMPLVDSKGKVTSHLSGLFYRTISIVENGITPIFIFDGIPPMLKRRTIEARASRREEAYGEWQDAMKKGLVEEARIHAMASTKINKEIVESSKELLQAMGIPFLQAPSEGEAQAARLVKEGFAYAAASQDYDLFLFGSDIVIRNLTITGRRKLPKKNVYIEVNPEMVLLKKLLEKFEITQRDLIWIGLLIGTDFNTGIDGIGPATALKLVKIYREKEQLVKAVKEKYQDFDVDPFEVEKIFTNPDTRELSLEEQQSLNIAKPNMDKITKIMCDEHEFSHERIIKFAEKLEELSDAKGQKSLF